MNEEEFMKGEYKKMKTDIKQIGNWWKWNEYCNNCAKQIRDYNSSSSEEPERDKEGFCLDCLRKISDGIIGKNQ